jgi:hypothetical protein
MEFVRRNSSYGVVLGSWRRTSRTMMLRRGPMQFSRFDPFHALISCKFEGKPLCPHNECDNIDEDVAVDSLSSKVEVLIRLNEKGSHQSG